ncbi:MAG: hypothetical protein COX70_08250, partial [Flavobacteriales bacterium CG_4_10_14_0_2_um_filter_32_8]
WAATGSDKTALVRIDFNAINRNHEPPKVEIQSVKVLGENVCWYNLKSEDRRQKSEENQKNPADSTVNYVDSLSLLLAQFNAFGKSVPQELLDSQRTKFAGIQFDGITAFYPLPKKLVLPYKFNHISFNYNAIELARPYLVKYQYMLEGMDEDWSAITTKTDVNYTNLSEGTYTFKLKALYTGASAKTGGDWSEPITYTFKVLPPWYRTWWMYTVYGLLLVAIIVFIVWWNGRRLRAKAKELTEEVRKATKEITKQKDKVEEKHKEITDSINYAERIQRSFLATTEMLDKYLGVTSSADEGGVSRSERNYFVFFRPKAVVSGDFYWAGELNNGNFAFICADSTGHGVPGAIMSILNISSLEKSIEKETEPHAILNTTRKIIIERLKKDGSVEGGKDGMDCSLLVINKDRTQLSFASANNPVFIVNPNRTECPVNSLPFGEGRGGAEFKPDKMPVGKHDNDAESFTLHSTMLKKGDVIYALTDGFTDQFGGEKGKKYMIKNLKELLLKIAHLPMLEQEQKLAEEFDKWKGSNEQVDDVCIMGVRI